MDLFRYAGMLIGGLLYAQAAGAALIQPPGNAATVKPRFAELYGQRLEGSSQISAVTEAPGSAARPVLKVKLDTRRALQRADFFLNGEQSPLNETKPRWYAMSVFLPPDWQPAPEAITLAQIEGVVAGAELPPALSLQVSGKKLFLDMNFNHLSAGVDDASAAHRRFPVGAAEPGKWYCMVVSANWSATPGAGKLYVYLNNKEVFASENTHNSYVSALHIPRVGFNAPAGTDVGTREMYTDFIWVGDESANRGEMLKKTPCAGLL